MSLGAFLMFVGIVVVWFGGPSHGVNGTTVLGVILFLVGLVRTVRTSPGRRP